MTLAEIGWNVTGGIGVVLATLFKYIKNVEPLIQILAGILGLVFIIVSIRHKLIVSRKEQIEIEQKQKQNGND